jgi:GTP-binding protein
MDLPGVSDIWPDLQKEFNDLGYKVFAISALARNGLKPLLWAAYHSREEVEIDPLDEEIPVYKLEDDPEIFEISREEDGAWRVVGKAVERAAAMTYWEYDEAVRRFQRILEHLGVQEALEEAGVQPNDTVRIGENELEWQD